MHGAFKMTRRVQFAETDAAGILHFANYFRIMEETEHAFWRSIGLSIMSKDGDREIGWPRVATRCEYSGPARFEDELELTFNITSVGDQSYTFDVRFRCHGHSIAVVTTTAVCCALDSGDLSPMTIPDPIRSKLVAALADAP